MNKNTDEQECDLIDMADFGEAVHQKSKSRIPQDSGYRCGMTREEWIRMNSIDMFRPAPERHYEPEEELAGGRYLTLNERMTERARLDELSRNGGGYGHVPKSIMEY